MPDVCGFCKKEAVEWILNPNNKSEHAIICVDCGKIAGIYCEKHEVPHQGFEDGSTACRSCIHETFLLNMERREEVAQFISSSLPPEEFGTLKEAAEDICEIAWCDWQACLLRFVVSKAFRNRESLGVTIGKLAEEGTAAFLLQ